MCVAGDDESSSSSADETAMSYSDDTYVPEITVTASRLGLNLETLEQIDWTEVVPAATIGAVTGGYNGGVGGAVMGGLAAGATSIESQDDIDIVDMFDVVDDMVVIPGIPGGYIPLY